MSNPTSTPQTAEDDFQHFQKLEQGSRQGLKTKRVGAMHSYMEKPHLQERLKVNSYWDCRGVALVKQNACQILHMMAVRIKRPNQQEEAAEGNRRLRRTPLPHFMQ